MSYLLGVIALALLATLIYLNERARSDRAQRESEFDLERMRWDRERDALLDRIQSGDIQQYKGIRAAYHPEQDEPEITYWHDEFGYLSEPAPSDRGTLPDPE